jgi:hypothetical protein
VNQEKRLVVRLGLRTFGETFPERVMGFAAEGSATIKVDVGKKLRPADRSVRDQGGGARARSATRSRRR